MNNLKNKVTMFNNLIENNDKVKTCIFIIVFVVIFLVWLFIIILNQFTPEKEALKYFEAFSNNDAGKLYNYLDVNNEGFTSKKAFKNIMKYEEDKEITSYLIEDVEISEDNREAIVSIKYIVKGVKTNIMKIKLVKENKKQVFYFDKWKVISDVNLVEDYKIAVMKDSKVKISGITLDEKYFLETTNSLDIYEIPLLFEASYPVVIEYPVGIKVEKNINPSLYSKKEILNIELNDFSNKDKEKIEKLMKDNLQFIYDSALNNKTFNDITINFLEENDVENTYVTFCDSLNKRAQNLKSVTFNKITLNKIKLTDEGYIKVSFKVNYDYETDDKYSNSMYSSITFDAHNENKIVDFNNFKTYF